MRPSELPKRENGDKRPHLGLRILQEGSKERGSLVGKGDQAKPCRNVLWACIQDPNHRLVVTSHGEWGPNDGTHPNHRPLGFFLPCSPGHRNICHLVLTRHLLVLLMSQLEACCSFTAFIHGLRFHLLAPGALHFLQCLNFTGCSCNWKDSSTADKG